MLFLSSKHRIGIVQIWHQKFKNLFKIWLDSWTNRKATLEVNNAILGHRTGIKLILDPRGTLGPASQSLLLQTFPISYLKFVFVQDLFKNSAHFELFKNFLNRKSKNARSQRYPWHSGSRTAERWCLGRPEWWRALAGTSGSQKTSWLQGACILFKILNNLEQKSWTTNNSRLIQDSAPWFMSPDPRRPPPC